jgi:glycosyltransferase involved in cell wall biosynthesis
MDPAPDVILVYGTALGYLARLIPLARRLGIPLVIDATEWYESSHLPGGRWGPFAMANSLSMRRVAPKADGVMAISSFLENYFAGQGVATMRVPPLFALEEASRQAGMNDETLTLCYVGSPGLKDRQTLDNLVRLPGELECNRDQLRIHIVGVDESAATALLGDEMAVAIQHECLVFHGRVTSSNARQTIADSHFSVLQRGEERYAQAGYPSKIPESLLLGTPVMANLTSDLANVLVDGKNSRILADASLASLASTVSETLVEPYRFSRSTIAAEARSDFAPAQYAQSIHDFLAGR